MATYTTVTEGYDVHVFPSFTALWEHLQGALPTDVLWRLDDCGDCAATQSALRKELKEQGVARIYLEDATDWEVRVQLHSK